ncbi:carboxylesterase/lipase family protein [Agromyces protaetiae]|uniref:Carboxylic ester hydrolase n=1 Tax=Agromyces protaetiae TaxID=2509455 RepID=A0A4P6FQE2_9MICO|nr:carboxylesterase/lipase family protein [Agromyces protaetiae]QAY72748.1 carboxylesterase/lipase family protein [Agromyces protaetiae]
MLVLREDGTRADASRSLIVETDRGAVRGIRRRGVRIWRGIPYAASTAGRGRFRAPRDAPGWSGVRDASRFGPVAPQRRNGQFLGAPDRLARSEDCLTVNVIAPDERGTAGGGAGRSGRTGLRPVMVFIHGGAYTVGSSREYPHQGERLVRAYGVVSVSFNYRLGALGWLDFRAYAQPGHPFDVNVGLRDQVAALEWVRRNIGAFGGDPSRVTLYGESSGANAVTTLMTVPAAEGLFARAIAQSSPANAVYLPETAATWAREYVAELSRLVDEDDVEGEAVDEAGRMLRTADTELLCEAATALAVRTPDEYPGTISFAPVIDGDFLPHRPLDAFRDGLAHRVPLIIGTNDREGSLFEGRIGILPTTKPRIRAIFANTKKPARKAIKRRYPGLPERRAAADFGGDFTFWYPSVKVAERHSRYAPVFAYRFDAAPRTARLLELDATHGLELFALFEKFDTPVGTALTVLGGRRMFRGVGRRMQRHWTAFAASGRPGEGWPEYEERHRRTLVFDRVDRVVLDPRRKKRLAWQEFVPHV